MTDRDDATPTTNTTQDEGSVRGEGTVGERLVERLSITQSMLDDNGKLRAEIARLRLSSAEREAIVYAMSSLLIFDPLDSDAQNTLRSLLERLHT